MRKFLLCFNRNDVYYLDGILLVGQDGCLNKLHVRLDSDNVSDVLEIRPHATLKEKEAEGYETGVKPGRNSVIILFYLSETFLHSYLTILCEICAGFLFWNF